MFGYINIIKSKLKLMGLSHCELNNSGVAPPFYGIRTKNNRYCSLSRPLGHTFPSAAIGSA